MSYTAEAEYSSAKILTSDLWLPECKEMQSAVLSHHTSGHTCHLVVKHCSLSTSSITAHLSSLLPQDSKVVSVRKQAKGICSAPGSQDTAPSQVQPPSVKKPI